MLDKDLPAPDGRLDALAEAIADGHVIDWASIESSLVNDDERTLVARLRVVAQIAGLHGSSSVDAASPQEHGAAHAPPATGQWGSLDILEHVGAGRFGDVYRAWDPALQREVALKLLRHSGEHRSLDDSLVVREGRLMARVRHPNVVTIHGAQRIDGQTGLWMEFIRGRTLHAELHERGPFEAAELIRVGVELSRALASVHAAGLVHRDVKAQNVMRGETGRIVLGDFGTGHELEESAAVGLTGTPVYLAPEIFRGEPATPKSDLYSLGALLFYLATGRHRMQGRSVLELANAHSAGAVASVLESRPDLPPPLAAVIDRALNTDPSRRFDDAVAMEAALTAAANPSLGITKSTRGTWIAPRPILTAAAVVGLLAIAAWGARMLEQVSPVEPASGASAPARADALPPPARVNALLLPNEASAGEAAIAVTPAAVFLATRDASSRTRTGITLAEIDPDFSQTHRIYAVSANPRYVTCTVRGRQAIGICDLHTLTNRELRVPGVGERGEEVRLSPDGTRVAYVWYAANGSSVRMIDAGGLNDRELLPPEKNVNILTVKWLHEGRTLLVEQGLVTEGRRRYKLVKPEGGTPQLFWDFDTPFKGADVSPDGRFIVLERDRDGKSDLRLIDVADGSERWLVQDPSHDAAPRWAPDGTTVLYQSDRGGIRGLYTIRVVDGTVAGEPELVQNFSRGTMTPIGFSADGTLFVERLPFWYSVFRATIDLNAGSAAKPRWLDQRTSNEETPGVGVDPAGGRIAYVAGSFDDRTRAATRVVILNRDGTLQSELPLLGNAGRKSRVRWSSDGTRVAVNTHIKDRTVVEVVDAERGTTLRVIETRGAWDVKWDPVGDGVYYADGQEILRYDLTTGDVTTVYRTAVLPKNPLESGVLPLFPPGTNFRPLVTAATFDVSPVDGSLLLPVQGGARVVRPDNRIVDRPVPGMVQVFSVAWTRDGSRILVSGITQNRRRAAVVVMDPENGDPVQLSIDAEPIVDLSISPDDRELFFAAGNQLPGYWMLSGFLGR